MDAEIWAAIIGIAGSASIALAIYFGEIAVNKSRATMDLIRELHSPEMSSTRAQARRFVLAHLKDNFDSMEDSAGLSEQNQRDREALFAMTRFFYRLNVLRKNGLLQDGKIVALFGPLFAFWWAFSFEDQLVRSGWTLKIDIQELHDWIAGEVNHRKWFVGKATHNKKLEIWNSWLQVGIDDKASPAPPAVTPAQGSTFMADEIGKLWALKEQGAITAAEFTRTSARLLAR